MKKIPLYLLVILLLLPLAGCSEHTCDFAEPVPDSRNARVSEERTFLIDKGGEYLSLGYVIVERELYSSECGKIAAVPIYLDAHPNSFHGFSADAPVTGDYECRECGEIIHADFTGWAEHEVEIEGMNCLNAYSEFVYENPEVGAAHKGKDDEYIKNYSELYLPQHKPA